MGSVVAKLVRGTDGEAERPPQEQEPARTEPHHQQQQPDKVVVRCGQMSAGLPGNKAYTAELTSFRGRFIDFPEERENILDHFLARFTFLREHSDHPLSEKEARAKVRKSLSDPTLSRLPARLRSDPMLSQPAARPRPVSVTPRRAHPHETRFATKTARSIVPQQLLRQEAPSSSSEEDDSLSEDYTSSEEEDASCVPAKNRATGKVAVRLGTAHSKLKGNIAYNLAVTNRRGDYSNAPPNSDTRSRIIDYFVDRFAFLDDKGRVLVEQMAREKVRLALRRDTRPSPAAAARASKRQADSELSSDDDSQQESSGEKLIVRSGKGSSGCFLPGNVAYRNEISNFRAAYINGDNLEKERIFAHFLDRFIFVHGHSDKRLSKREAKTKLRGVLSDARPLKRKASMGAPQISSRPLKQSRCDS